MTDSFEVNVKNQTALIAALAGKKSQYEQAALYGITQVAFAIEAEAKGMFQGTHKRGEKHVANSTGGPNVVTGALRRSIHTEVRKGFGSYAATVFPTMIYSRAVEWGKGSSGVKYPYLTPAVAKVRPKANSIFTAAVARKMRG